MKDKPFTKEQAKMMAICFCGLLLLATPIKIANIINKLIGVTMIFFVLIMIYREFICNGSKEIKEKYVSAILIIIFIIVGISLILNNGKGNSIICAFGGICMIIWGLYDLKRAKEMATVYSASIFALIGTITFFYPYRTISSVSHIMGIFICYYMLSSFIKEKLG